jgi:hypothetical protein
MNAIDFTVLLVLGLLLGGAVWAAAASGLRLLRYDGRLRLNEAVEGQNLSLPLMDTDRNILKLANATRRCMLCTEHARCDKLLDAGDWTLLREICPNTAYIDGLRSS